jgi:hypothetical protein
MSKNPIRKDKTCLNCNHVVDLRFCPNCGQENTNTRKTFHHLFIHFFEDLTHYENAFWKTIRNLLFRPASLTKEYLSGKRLSYLAPVRLYIFISFITFFIIAIFPKDEDTFIETNQTVMVPVEDVNGKVIDSAISQRKVKIADLLKEEEERQKKENLSNEKINENFINFGYLNVKQLDSMQKYGPADEKLSDWEYNMIKKTLEVKAKYSKKELTEKLFEQSSRNFPKALFIYLPLFAFILWLFHGKRRWYYFDHGIFTLHYFSFLLLSSLLMFFFIRTMDCFVENPFTSVIKNIGKGVGYLWMFYYFFPAHHRFYGESRIISFIKSCFIFVINVLLFILLLLIFFIYTFISIH